MREDDEHATEREPEMEPIEPVEVEGAEARLLSFYDRLRSRIRRRLARGRLGEATADVLLVAPDLFMLLVRLMLDPEVPRSSRALIGGALAYFLLPADLLPEGLIGMGGFVDDVVLASGILAQVLTGDLAERAERYWSGPTRLRVVLRDVARSTEAVLGERVRGRVQRLARRMGEQPSP